MPRKSSYDYEDLDIFVTIKDTGVPSGGRFMAAIELWHEGRENPVWQYYEHGATFDEALEKAKQWIAEYRAEIR